MKRTFIIAGCIALAYILLTSDFTSYGKGAQILPEVSTSPAASSDSLSTRYIMKEHNKRVAVFESGNSEPIFISDVLVRDLPKADRELLADGISAQSKKDLDRLIQDFCS